MTLDEINLLRRRGLLPPVSNRCAVASSAPDAPDPRLRAPAVRENQNCYVNTETGEIRCQYRLSPPGTDCRHASCPHAPEMRTRLLGRLRAYAVVLNQNAGR